MELKIMSNPNTELVSIDKKVLDELKKHLESEFNTYHGLLKPHVSKAVKEYLKKEVK